MGQLENLSHSQLKRLLKEQKQKRYKESLYDLCREILDYNDVGQVHQILEKFIKDKVKNFKLLLIPRGHLKALRVDTKIPTPDGFKTISDIRVGDFVYGVDGMPTRVNSVTLPEYRQDVYEIEFSTGEKIVCDAGHLWETDARRDRENFKPNRPCPSIKTTERIAYTVKIREERNHRVRVAASIQAPAQEFIVQPYSLGAWLGDGTSSAGNITLNDPQIIEEIRADGELVTKKKHKFLWAFNGGVGTDGFRKNSSFCGRLRKIGVLNNKHIPQNYMRASESQRMALLQGLMDSDGTISKAGQCAITNKRKALVEQIRELICSLGMKCSYVYQWDAFVKGKNCGPVYTVSFYCYPDRPVFRLKRKLDRIREKRKTTLQNYRQIVAVEKAEPCHVKCISVESQDKLFLISDGFIPTHNSSFVTVGYSIQSLIQNPNERILIANAVWDNSRLFLREIKEKVQTEKFKEYFGDWKSENWNQDEITILPRKRVFKEPSIATTGVERSITGLHFDKIIMDDVVGASNITSIDQINKVISFFESLIPILEPNGKIIVIGTRWDELDLYGHIEAKLADFFEKMVMQVEYNGKYIFPEKFNDQVLAVLKASMRPSFFSSQYYNITIPEEDQLFKRTDFQYWGNKSGQKPLPTNLSIYTTVDLAMSEKHDADETAVVTCGWDERNNFYILDVQHGRWGSQKKIDVLYDVYARYKPIRIGIEKAAGQQFFLDLLNWSEQNGKERLPTCDVEHGNKRKEDRIANLEPLFRAKKVFLAENCIALEQQLLKFTMKGTKGLDDVIDCAAMQLKIYSPAQMLENNDGWAATQIKKNPKIIEDPNFYRSAQIWEREAAIKEKQKFQNEEDAMWEGLES